MSCRRYLQIASVACTLAAFSAEAFVQATFFIPFKFDLGGKMLPPGEYQVELETDGRITLKLDSKSISVSITPVKTLAPKPRSVDDPQLVFDMVGNFEPSYSEYITDHVLREIWFGPDEVFLVATGDPARQQKTVKGRRNDRLRALGTLSAVSNGEGRLTTKTKAP